MTLESARFPAPGIAVLIAFALLAGAGCAKIADPQPPQIRIPKPAVDLVARQLADFIVLTVSVPDQNTDGSAATALRFANVFRLAEDAQKSESPAPIPEEQFMKRAVRILSIPESQFSSYLQERVFVIQDRLSFPEKSMIYSSSFRYAVLFANNRNKAAGLSNQVLIKPLPIPLPPSGLSAEITEGSINLKWALPSENMDGSKPARIAGYNIYKAEEPRMLPAAPINSDPVQNPAYEDHSFQFDKTYYYAVSIVGNIANPRAESQLSEVLSAVSRDVFPPAPPKNFTALPDGGSILLLWAPSVSPDVAGYRIYRIEEGTKTEQLLQNELIITLSYRDNHVNSDKRCQYRILAVDTHGNESTPVLAAVEIQ